MYESKYLGTLTKTANAIPYHLEKRLVNCILHGKGHEAVNIFEEIIAQRPDNEPLDEQKMSIASLISYCSRKLIDKGCCLREAHSIQNRYFQLLINSVNAFECADLVHDIIHYYSGYFAHIKKNAYSYHVQRVMHYIEENMYGRLTVSSISENLGLNNAYLSSLFKEETGQSLKQTITVKKINQAKTLLCDTDKTVNEISKILGFSSQSLFAQRFKDLVSLSPTDYRNLIHI